MADPQVRQVRKVQARVRPQIKVSGMVADGLGLDKRLCRQAPDQGMVDGVRFCRGRWVIRVRRLRYNSIYMIYT